MTPLVAALDLAGQGYAAFPCRPDKRPACPHGFKQATSDTDELRELWRQYPGSLVGVATGPASDISVLDIDKKHREAHEWWAAHRAELLPTQVHRTRSGGLHLLYTDPGDGLKCSASKIAKGIDVRAEGGYVIWWPAAGLPVLSGAHAPAPWPRWLTPLAMAAPAQTAPRPSLPTLSRLPPSRPGDLRPTLHRALGLANTVAAAGEGERNCILHWAACRAAEMIKAGEIDQAAGNQLVESLHNAALQAGLQHHEIARTIHSALRAAAA
jgi:hypothetical protein